MAKGHSKLVIPLSYLHQPLITLDEIRGRRLFKIDL
jgi:hypothetical protein